jgi:hypothetical protein
VCNALRAELHEVHPAYDSKQTNKPADCNAVPHIWQCNSEKFVEMHLSKTSTVNVYVHKQYNIWHATFYICF